MSSRIALVFLAVTLHAESPKTRNVIFVMTDGLRWQEVFRGAEDALIKSRNLSITDREDLEDRYVKPAREARREALMPFLWTVVAKQGQIYGNRDRGSEAYVTNGRNFSYPGYNEMLTGFPDPRIDSNAKNPNANVTVFEWLHAKPELRGKVAAFGAWDVFPFIFNAQRAGFPVNAAYEPFTPTTSTPRLEIINRLKAETTHYWDNEAFDSFPFQTALEHLKSAKPRLLYLSLGETDEWGHAGHYKHYLTAARRVDDYLKTLWETAQSMPQYRGTTTLIVGTDHGRGEGEDWKNHGEKVPDSKYVWMAFLGPDTPPLGERTKIDAVTQSQVAATIAALLGHDYAAAQPKAAKPFPEVVRKR